MSADMSGFYGTRIYLNLKYILLCLMEFVFLINLSDLLRDKINKIHGE